MKMSLVHIRAGPLGGEVNCYANSSAIQNDATELLTGETSSYWILDIISFYFIVKASKSYNEVWGLS